MLSAIVSILIGNFLIGLLFKPALEHLQRIREDLLLVVIPVDDAPMRSFGSRPWDSETLRKAHEAARHAINEILRKYTLAYEPFKRIGLVFVVAILLLVNFTILVMPLTLDKRALLCVSLTAIVLLLVRFLSADAYPAPHLLSDLDYLVGHFANIHPESLIRLLNVGVQRVNEDKHSRLALSCAVHLTGYKFFVAMTNEDESQVYLVSYGKIGTKTKVNCLIGQDYYRWLIPLADIDPKWPNGLNLPVSVHLYIFLPPPVGWKDPYAHPYFVSHELWVANPGDPNQHGEVCGTTPCSPHSKDKLVEFKRKKARLSDIWELSSIKTDADRRDYRLRRLLAHYKRKVEKVTAICTSSGSQLAQLR